MYPKCVDLKNMIVFVISMYLIYARNIQWCNSKKVNSTNVLGPIL